MSDRERYGSASPKRGGTNKSGDDKSRSRSRSASPRGRSHSRSRSHSPRRKRSYSYSRSRSRTPPRHRHKRSRSRSYSGSPVYSHSRHSRRRQNRSYSRSRSRSRSRSYSRSRSRSYSPNWRRGSRQHNRRDKSHSPMSSRRRHEGNRYNPDPSCVLGVFGLSLYTGEKDLRDLLSKYGHITEVQVVYDHQTGRSRGFSFVYFEDVEDAIEAKEHCNGVELDGRKIRVDYSITGRPHTPTPGVYMGKPTRPGRDDRNDDHRDSRGSRYGRSYDY